MQLSEQLLHLLNIQVVSKVPEAYATTDGEEDADGVETVGDERLPIDKSGVVSVL